MNHEITCKYCNENRRLYSEGHCCVEYIKEERERKKLELENVLALSDLLIKRGNIISYPNEFGGIVIAPESIIKMIKLLGEQNV